MKLQLIEGELTPQETKDILRMLKRKGHFDFGSQREYKYVGKDGFIMEIRITNTSIKSSSKYREVKVKLN